MKGKWIVLAGTMLAGVALTAGLSVAADDESPLHKLMEQVNAKNVVVTKGVRTAVNFKKAQKDVVKAAEELAKLGKDAKPIKDAVKKSKGVKDATDAKWDALMDDFIKSSEELAKVAGKSDATFDKAKTAHSAVKKSCSECHMIFRVEEEGFK